MWQEYKIRIDYNMQIKIEQLQLLRDQLLSAGNAEQVREIDWVIAEATDGKFSLVPTTPTKELLNSMGLRYRHDFGLDRQEDSNMLTCGVTDEERESIRTTMRQLHEEVVGTGFYHPSVKERYRP